MWKLFEYKRLKYWFASYLLIAFFTVMFNFIAYMQIDNKMSEQNGYYVEEILENRKNQIDNLRKLADNFAMEVQKNENISRVANLKGDLYGEGYQSVIEARNALYAYNSIEYGFKDFYVYYPNINYCVGTTDACEAGLFFENNVTDAKMNKNDWFRLMNENHSGKMTVIEGENEKTVYYLLSIRGYERFVPLGTIVVELDTEGFITSSYKQFGNSFYIIDKDNRIFMSEKNDNWTKVENILSKEKVEDGIKTYGKNTMIAKSSADGEYTYIYFMDKTVFSRSVNQARMIIVLFNMLCLVAVVLIAAMFSHRNYKPVKKIVSIIGGGDAVIDEFSYIEESISSMAEKNRELGETSEKMNNKFVRVALLARLLGGGLNEHDKNEVLATLELLNVKFTHKNFAVVLFYIEIISDMFFDNKDNRVEENYELARVVITDVFAELCGEDYNVNFCEVNGYLGCIMNMKDKNCTDFIVDRIQWMQKFVQENFNINFYAGVSTVYGKVEELNDAYSEALEGIKRRFYGFSGVSVYQKPIKSDADDFYISKDIIEQLTDFIRNGNYNRFSELLEKLFDERVFTSEKQIHLIKCVLYDLMLAVTKAVKDIGGMETGTVKELAAMVENVGVSIDAVKIKDKLLMLVEEVCDRDGNENLMRLDVVLEKVREFINSNYSDHSLSVTVIAERFDISTPYLSSCFKKKYSVGLLDYIAGVRVARAKELLLGANMSTENVAQSVGYANVRSLSRNFVRITGYTPNEYLVSMSGVKKQKSE